MGQSVEVCVHATCVEFVIDCAYCDGRRTRPDSRRDGAPSIAESSERSTGWFERLLTWRRPGNICSIYLFIVLHVERFFTSRVFTRRDDDDWVFRCDMIYCGVVQGEGHCFSSE